MKATRKFVLNLQTIRFEFPMEKEPIVTEGICGFMANVEKDSEDDGIRFSKIKKGLLSRLLYNQ